MLRPRPWVTRAAGAVILLVAGAAPAASTEAVRALVAAGVHPDLAWSDLRDVRADLDAVYRETGYAPIWLRDGGASEQARAVVAAMEAARERGLRPADYGAAFLAERVGRGGALAADGAEAARLDVALTVGLLRFLRHVDRGRIDPRRLGFGLDVRERPSDLPGALRRIARAKDVASELAALDPPFPLFGRLRAALAAYRALATRRDLLEVPEIATLHPGESSPAVGALRTRLAALGDVAEGAASAPLADREPPPAAEAGAPSAPPAARTPADVSGSGARVVPTDAGPPPDATRDDPSLVTAVEHFQRRHGLDADGIIGPATLAALRVPIAERATQIELAMERLRWLPRRPAERFLIVNIPEFRLVAFERERSEPVMASEVVVGSAARRSETPILRARMEHVVFRPYWHVPPGITRREIMPKTRADPGYLARHDMEIVGGRVRQRPGPDNALGLVKFIFPNRHHVYLHDTPARALFGRARRDFSHGCIRVARPVELAEFVLGDPARWPRERIVDAMQHGRDNVYVALARPVAVYLLYSTVIVSREGEVRFFADIYGHDAELKKALAQGPPYS